MIINSATKEDTEIWVFSRDSNDTVQPIKIIERNANVKCHIDHIRDFFVLITNHGVKSKNYKLTQLSDSNFENN